MDCGHPRLVKSVEGKHFLSRTYQTCHKVQSYRNAYPSKLGFSYTQAQMGVGRITVSIFPWCMGCDWVAIKVPAGKFRITPWQSGKL